MAGFVDEWVLRRIYHVFGIFFGNVAVVTSRKTSQCHGDGFGACLIVVDGGDVGMGVGARQCALATLGQQPSTQFALTGDKTMLH